MPRPPPEAVGGLLRCTDLVRLGWLRPCLQAGCGRAAGVLFWGLRYGGPCVFPGRLTCGRVFCKFCCPPPQREQLCGLKGGRWFVEFTPAVVILEFLILQSSEWATGDSNNKKHHGPGPALFSFESTPGGPVHASGPRSPWA